MDGDRREAGGFMSRFGLTTEDLLNHPRRSLPVLPEMPCGRVLEILKVKERENVSASEFCVWLVALSPDSVSQSSDRSTDLAKNHIKAIMSSLTRLKERDVKLSKKLSRQAGQADLEAFCASQY